MLSPFGVADPQGSIPLERGEDFRERYTHAPR